MQIFCHDFFIIKINKKTVINFLLNFRMVVGFRINGFCDVFLHYSYFLVVNNFERFQLGALQVWIKNAKISILVLKI
jgi:hypothetical protein